MAPSLHGWSLPRRLAAALCGKIQRPTPSSTLSEHGEEGGGGYGVSPAARGGARVNGGWRSSVRWLGGSHREQLPPALSAPPIAPCCSLRDSRRRRPQPTGEPAEPRIKHGRAGSAACRPHLGRCSSSESSVSHPPHFSPHHFFHPCVRERRSWIAAAVPQGFRLRQECSKALITLGC